MSFTTKMIYYMILWSLTCTDLHYFNVEYLIKLTNGLKV